LSEQDRLSASLPARPAPDDRSAWRAYWQQLGQPWRTEPEIDEERQKYLAERRAIVPDIENGIYPFKEMQLSRADVEWLLATHENGCGSVDWSSEKQWKYDGLDLRGADLRKAKLHDLPLARLRAGLTIEEWLQATIEQRDKAEVYLEGADLSRANIKEANLLGAHLERANLFEAHLENAILRRTHMEGTNLLGAHLVLQRDFTSAVPAVGQEVACDGSNKRSSCGVVDRRSTPTLQADPARVGARQPARASTPERH
jgi:Pentapeptide repeats (8 copies)